MLRYHRHGRDGGQRPVLNAQHATTATHRSQSIVAKCTPDTCCARRTVVGGSSRARAIGSGYHSEPVVPSAASADRPPCLRADVDADNWTDRCDGLSSHGGRMADRPVPITTTAVTTSKTPLMLSLRTGRAAGAEARGSTGRDRTCACTRRVAVMRTIAHRYQ